MNTKYLLPWLSLVCSRRFAIRTRWHLPCSVRGGWNQVTEWLSRSARTKYVWLNVCCLLQTSEDHDDNNLSLDCRRHFLFIGYWPWNLKIRIGFIQHLPTFTYVNFNFIFATRISFISLILIYIRNNVSTYVNITVVAWKKVENYVRSVNPKKCLKSTIPATGWLAKYQWKRDFLSDVIAGFTVAIMHIPQGRYYN